MHSLEFTFDFATFKETDLSTAYIAHMIADEYAHVDASVIQGFAGAKYRETQGLVDSICSQYLELQQVCYDSAEVSRELFDFV